MLLPLGSALSWVLSSFTYMVDDLPGQTAALAFQAAKTKKSPTHKGLVEVIYNTQSFWLKLKSVAIPTCKRHWVILFLQLDTFPRVPL